MGNPSARSARGEKALTEAEVEAFAESYAVFNEALSRLEASYRALEGRFDALNRELEATNCRLQESLSDKERLNSYLREILESLGSGVVVVDTEGNITLFNRAASTILGWPAQAALGKSCGDVLGEGAQDPLRTLHSGDCVHGVQKTLDRQAGDRVPVRFNTSRLHSVEGDVLGAIETFEDISQLQELSRQASRVSTLTALGEMAATVAHEIRNPLGGIGGFAGLLERDLEVDDPRRRLVKKMVEGVDSLNRMVTNLLNYTRPIQLNARPVDFVQIVEDSIGFFEIDAGSRLEGIDLQRLYESVEVPCRIDPEQMQQIVLNLLHNAVQAMPDGGWIQIGISEFEAATEGRAEPPPPYIAFSVADSGVGMSEEVRSKLFMPFFTTKEDGNGLGLATTKKVIEAHGGDILVESEPQRGSTFTILVPK